MRLFKCYDPFCIDDAKDQVLAVFAENEYEAIEKCAEIHKDLDCYYEPYETVLREWKAEEYLVARDCDVYICYPRDLNRAEDVKIISCPHSVKNVESYVMDKLVELECQEEYFRDNVKDKAVNCSFNERFYYDSKGWIFENGLTPEGNLDVREDIKIRVLEENMSINRFMDELWLDNVHDFFEDNEEYRDLFIEYITTNAEPEILDEGFFFYVCKKLMVTGQWVEYTDIRKVGIA